MSARLHYGTPAKIFHWAIVALLLVQYPIGWLMPDIHRDMQPGVGMTFHVSTGLVILSLIVAVAAFNIISTLVMVVKDKRSDIAILRTVGAAPRSILAIFLTQGVAIGAIGTLCGVLLGALISVNLEGLIHGLEALLGVHFLDAKVYFITDLPARVEWSDVLKISLTAFGLCCLSTLYPSWRAARTQPAQSLRHE